MSKHADTPWTVGISIIDGDAVTAVLDSHGDEICNMGNSLLDEGSNADFISAAPDMLAALEAVEWAGPQYDNGITIINTCPHCEMDEPGGHSDGCIIGNALKKARGEK